jgi:MoxR-like ATPase
MATIEFVEGPYTGQSLQLPESLTVGRSQICNLEIPDGKISGEHALIRMEGRNWWVYDLQSSNGTFVNAEQVEAVQLDDDDKITVGESTILFKFDESDTVVGDGLVLTDSSGDAPEGATSEVGSKPVKSRTGIAAAGKPKTVISATKPKTKTRPAFQVSSSGDDIQIAKDLNEAYRRMTEQISRVIVGQKEVIEQVLVAIFCRGHALLVGVPGLAKTLLVSTLSHALDFSFKRVQFTPDLMPSDITGTDVLEEDRTTGRRVFRFVQGPLFANMVLADEINRTPPKTQAALLEAMQEHRVTIGDKTYHLPEPFFVLATQNPIEQEGTYPLPEAQLDRFMFEIIVDYPDAKEEAAIIKQVTGTYKAELEVALTAQDVLRLQQIVRRVPAADHVIEYARDLARMSRPNQPEAPDFVREMVAWGAGPRAGIYLITAAKARAILHGRYHATTADVRAVALPVLRHRVITTFNAEAAGVKSDEIVRMLIDQIKPVEDVDV